MPNKRIILTTGQKFGRLTVIKHDDGRYWLCKCDCGKEKSVRSSNLKSKHTLSCGCLKVERHTKHGRRRKGIPDLTYGSWKAMKWRCNSLDKKNFANYGARGITVCPQWEDFAVFLKDMGDRPSKLHTIERIDNDGNYEPSNCRWATMKEQNNNTRRSYFIEYRGEVKTLPQWSEHFGLPRYVLRRRLQRGWSIEKALETLATRRNHAIEYLGEVKDLYQWAEHFGISAGNLASRLHRGWTIERALETP